MALGQILSELGANTVRLARQRIELAALDLEEEVLRQGGLLVGAVATVLMAALALAAAATLVAVYFWDSARIPALVGITCFFTLAAIVMARKLQVALRSKPPFMAGTLTELERDAEHLEQKP